MKSYINQVAYKLQNCLVVSFIMLGLSANSAFAQDYEYKSKLELEPARRYFVRFGYTYAKPNNKWSDVRDLTGPVIQYNEANRYTNTTQVNILGKPDANGNIPAAGSEARFTGVGGDYNTAYRNLVEGRNGLPGLNSFILLEATQAGEADIVDTYSLGTPSGVTQRAGGAGTPTISIGAFLDADYKWAVEAFVLAIPPEVKIYGAGRIGTRTEPFDETDLSDPDLAASSRSVDLGQIASTRMLPPIVILHRYFGQRGDKLRTSLGMGAMYAIFYGVKATSSLEDYVGGPSKIKIKNSFGFGPFAGARLALSDRWSFNATLGYVKLKTKATISTESDPIRLASSPAVLQAAYDQCNRNPGHNPGITRSCYTLAGIGTVTQIGSLAPTLRQVARARAADFGSNPNTIYGVREVSGSVDPWVLSVSMGYDF